MKHKISIAILTLSLLLGTSALAGLNASLNAGGGGGQVETATASQTLSFVFDAPQYEAEGDYTVIEKGDNLHYTSVAGTPMLPYAVRTLAFPAGTVVNEITVTTGPVHHAAPERPVVPVPQPLPLNMQPAQVEYRQGPAYETDAYYPDAWVSTHTGMGLHDGQHVLHLSLRVYPVRYHHVAQELSWTDRVEVTVRYRLPSAPLFTADSSDLLIVAPGEFTETLQPLVEHKESRGLATTLVTLDDIYNGVYFEVQGRDQQEQIKYFIKHAVEDWGVTYVLLVGGMRGQQFEWYVPVRYTNNHAGSPYETGFISDLYYADLYKYEEGEMVFEDWDSNGNGIFAEFTNMRKDILDLHPDVYLGRLPCRNLKDVEVIVDKIITYENGKPAQQEWFNRMLLIGGDTYPNAGDPYAYEAEIDTNLSGSYMTPAFNLERLWASTGTLTGQADVEAAISQGCGFIHMAGHANPGTLVTHPPQDEEGRIVILDIYNIPPVNALWALYSGGIPDALERLTQPWMPTLTNGDRLPVVVVGGCHNSQFNTSLLNILKYGFVHAYGYGIHVPKCWSWWLTSLPDGGSIATLGNTGLGMGIPAWNYTEGLDGWLFPRFFYHYGVSGIDILAPIQAAAIDDYVNTFDTNRGDADRQMVTQWALFGDPSLKIGGYP
ncbi:MAG: C25 family cysteine peptidase [Candidatus Thermoplasmatota archaeon]|nr:C25 family cysteine peptidase [Candidatus Thermoplasmatota archaeon]